MSEIRQEDRKRGFVTLDSIIRSALMDIGESIHRYEQLKHYAISGYRQFQFDVAQSVKTVQLDLTAWKSAETPVDYVDWVIVGFLVNNKIRAFTNDERISLFQPDVDEDGFPDERTTGDDDLPVIDDVNNRIWFWNGVNQFGEDTGQLYGLTTKGNGNGYFKWNSERREFQFDVAVNADTKIYLEYITDGFDPNEATVVNLYAADLIRLYIHWQRLKYAKSSALWQIREAKDDYYTEFKRVQGRINKITVEDVLDCARDAYRLISSL